MFGHVKQKKGGLFFLETLLASGRAERFHLLFVGELDETILEFLQTHQAEIAHSIFPFADRYDLLRHYAACDMVVIASFYDGLPNVLLEAAGLGVSLLASTAGGMADVLEDEHHGFLFYPGDEHECRQALERAANAGDEDLRRMGENCLALVRERLTAQIEADAYIAVLLETLRERSENAELDNLATLISGD